MPRGEHPNSRANLKKCSERTAIERQMIASKGGKAASEKRKKKAELKELAQAWLDTEIKDKNGTVLSGGEALIQFAVKQAAKGNVRAMAFIRDTAGQKPVENVNVAQYRPDPEAVNKMLEELAAHAEE